jgi:flagellar basal body rod protein FlgG
MRAETIRNMARSLRYWELRNSVLANDLANVESPGYRGQRVFARLLEGGRTVAEARTDFQPGSVSETGNPLDVALGGPGFFLVRTEAGERLTRAGSFRLDQAGRLLDGSGNPVMGENGTIVLPPGEPSIGPDGTVRVDGERVARLRIVEPADRGSLLREGGTRFAGGAGLVDLPGSARQVKQGYLEDANLSPVEGMVDMVSIQRNHAASQRSMDALDQVLRTITNDLARPV